MTISQMDQRGTGSNSVQNAESLPEDALVSYTEILEDEPDANPVVRVRQTGCATGDTADKVAGEYALRLCRRHLRVSYGCRVKYLRWPVWQVTLDGQLRSIRMEIGSVVIREVLLWRAVSIPWRVGCLKDWF
jgi:hypothetical protein